MTCFLLCNINEETFERILETEPLTSIVRFLKYIILCMCGCVNDERILIVISLSEDNSLFLM